MKTKTFYASDNFIEEIQNGTEINEINSLKQKLFGASDDR